MVLFYKDPSLEGTRGTWVLLRVLQDRFPSPQGLHIRHWAQGGLGRPPTVVVADCGWSSLREYYLQTGEQTASGSISDTGDPSLVAEPIGCGTLWPCGVTGLGPALLVHMHKVGGSLRSGHT